MHCLPVSLVLLWTLGSLVQGYTLAKTYKGHDFINEFDFWDGYVRKDPTGTETHPSAAFYMPRAKAVQMNLVRVNHKGQFILAADSTHVYNGTRLRPSVRIHSKESFHHGVLILDAAHLPHGKTTWPAFWSDGADGKWPYSGEIDIIEGIDNSVKNVVSYHTGPHVCKYDLSKKQSAIFHEALGTDCNSFANDNQACGNVDPNPRSYGAGANEVGGGVWALEWTPNAIKTWHFERKDIPKDILEDNPDPKRWGIPVTHLASTHCRLDKAFGRQTIIFNIELCGTWAGSKFHGGPHACVDYVQKHPDTFETAFFKINHLKYYT